MKDYETSKKTLLILKLLDTSGRLSWHQICVRVDSTGIEPGTPTYKMLKELVENGFLELVEEDEAAKFSINSKGVKLLQELSENNT